MDMQYKAILANKTIYKEIPLPANATTVSVGTAPGVDVRLSKNLFFEQFELLFTNEGSDWVVTCSPNVYISAGSSSKLPQKQLVHGDELQVKYHSTDVEMVSMSIMVDFDEVDQDFFRVIDLKDHTKVMIGGANQCDIQITDKEVANDLVALTAQGQGWQLEEVRSNYGVYVNGTRIQRKALLRNHDFFALDKYKFFVRGSRLYTTEAPEIQVHGLAQRLEKPSSNSLAYPKFNRTTRMKTKPNTEEITVLDPPEMPQKPQESLVATLLPALAMLVVTVVIRGMMSSTSSSFVLLSVCTMGIGIVTSIANYISNKKKYKKEVEERRKKFTSYIDQKKQFIDTARQEELQGLEQMYYSDMQDAKHIMEFSDKLFDRTASDDDFVEVYLGKGSRTSLRQIKYKEQEKIEVVDDLAQVPEKIKEDYKELEGAPVTLALSKYDAVGVVGSYRQNFQMLKNMTMDLASRHYYTDLHLYYICSEEHAAEIRWARWLPHTENAALGIRNIVCDTASRNLIFEQLFVQLSAEKERNSKNDTIQERSVLFVLDDMGINQHPISQYIRNCKEKGVTFVFFSSCPEYIPQNCGALIRMGENNGEAELIQSDDSQNVQKFVYDILPDALVEQACLKLAPVYCDEVSLEGSLTKNYSFFQMMNIFGPEDLDLQKNWDSANIKKTMRAPLGINAKKETVYLDLHEKAHGPHGLVAGTTGSGKSEILQSYILSMAIHYHPYEVGFLIIDFKGGGMANQFRNLPHMLGAITNIDGKEIDRSLKSIKAELQKRQRLFAEYDVNKIDDYIEKFKQGQTKIALPHLIIVVDEFAELKADQPEFMKELISAARIGRSLGVHLILATQKPSGQVNEQIWSNSKFKLCLKVQNQEDSKEVIKSPLAAEIREPGRAYLQVGNNEIFELFQSAYSGGASKADENVEEHEFSLQECNLWGKRDVIYRKTKNKTGEEGRGQTQLDVVVGYIENYCETSNIQKLANICLPPLPEVLPYQMADTKAKQNIEVGVGLYDDPDNQYQGKVVLDLTASNTMIIGSSQYGKTNLLEVLLRGLQEQYTPQQVNVYILDFGSMILKNFEGSQLVGGVVCASEDEKVKNLFRLIMRCLAERKEKLSKVGVSSFASYLEAGYTDMPQIVIMVDNFIGLRELYLSDDDVLLPICRDGLSYGISVIMTTLQSSSVGYRYMSNFAQKVVLYCNDSGEYSSVFDRCRMQPSNVPGRGLIEMDKTVYEFQSYLCYEAEREIERVKAIREEIAGANRRFGEMKAKPIPEIPTVLDMAYLQQNFNEQREPYRIPIAMDYESVEWVMLDLRRISTICVTGRERFGKTNLLKLVMNHLQNNLFDEPSEVFIFDDYRRQLADFTKYSMVEKYTVDRSELDIVLDQMEAELKERQKMVRDGLDIRDEPMLLCVLQDEDILTADGLKKAQADIIRRIVKNYGKLKVCFIFSDVENAAFGYSAPEGIKLARESASIILFDDLSNLKLMDAGTTNIRKFRKPVSLGDAYLITDKNVIKQKVIHAEE